MYISLLYFSWKVWQSTECAVYGTCWDYHNCHINISLRLPLSSWVQHLRSHQFSNSNPLINGRQTIQVEINNPPLKMTWSLSDICSYVLLVACYCGRVRRLPQIRRRMSWLRWRRWGNQVESSVKLSSLISSQHKSVIFNCYVWTQACLWISSQALPPLVQIWGIWVQQHVWLDWKEVNELRGRADQRISTPTESPQRRPRSCGRRTAWKGPALGGWRGKRLQERSKTGLRQGWKSLNRPILPKGVSAPGLSYSAELQHQINF